MKALVVESRGSRLLLWQFFNAHDTYCARQRAGLDGLGQLKKVDDDCVELMHADIDAVLNMAPTDQKSEVVPPAEEPEEMPLPSDPKVIFLGGLFVLALLATVYVASEIVCHWSLLSFSSSCCC